MSVWERELVLALSPDSASTVAARRLATLDRWSATGSSADAVWGRCRGSGPTPYHTMVDLAGPAYACSCPSRKLPCKHALALLLLWADGQLPQAGVQEDETTTWLRSRRSAGDASKPAGPVDPEAAARRSAARTDKVSAGLEDLELWLQDQVRSGLAGLDRAGYAHFDRVAARMVDAQAPGVATMLRSVPVELTRDGWPGPVLERLAALHLLVQAHRRLNALPPVLAANVRARVGYPVSKADVLAGPGVRDDWLALGAVDTVDYQLESRRVWLLGSRTGRWGLELSFAAPGLTLASTLLPGQRTIGDLHFYPGSSWRAVFGERDSDETPDQEASDTLATPASGPAQGWPVEDFTKVRRRMAGLLADDPWAGRLPALVAATPVPPTAAGQPWRLRDVDGLGVDLVGLSDDPWPLLARSGGDPVPIFGEWSPAGFRPLSMLPDGYGALFSTGLVATS